MVEHVVVDEEEGGITQVSIFGALTHRTFHYNRASRAVLHEAGGVMF